MRAKFYTIVASLIVLGLAGFLWHTEFSEESTASAMVPFAKTMLNTVPVKVENRLHLLLQVAQMVPSLPLPTESKSDAKNWGIKILRNATPWANKSKINTLAQAVLLGELNPTGEFTPREIMFFLEKNLKSSGERWQVLSKGKTLEFALIQDLDQDNDGTLDGEVLKAAPVSRVDSPNKNGFLHSQLIGRLQLVPEMQTQLSRYLEGTDTRVTLDQHLATLWTHLVRENQFDASQAKNNPLKVSQAAPVAD